ncbi:gamma-glutamylcyclotransferase [Reinekea marina]|uniref:glutathione-specific gamma-glutamylcyclotransferase n=1 Tax=Reinekea marina TaxID=1310421 RepID=A0ABV7WUS8_9GAMM|nr:gamma-glutamylcyclotransferase [Reinekea marina]MDN3650112.1 gamma-glutamylcyclotransferase [Reinekea marina]
MAHIDRESIKNGFFQKMAQAAHDKGLITLTSAEERERSWRQTLSTNPNQDGSVWVFAYGSLLWNPAMHISEKTDAYLEGYHRDFCLQTYVGRGSETHPGLVLGLEQGGSCHGQALKVDPSCIEEEFSVLWSREMVASAYQPLWLPLKTDKEATLYAVAFVMDKNSPQYAGSLNFEQRCIHLAQGEGALGSAADYLFETVNALHGLGINDERLDKYVKRVESLLNESRTE